MTTTRMEKDALGEYPVPADAYYGIQTARIVDAFQVSGERAHPRLLWAYAALKKAAALANADCGAIPKKIAEAIAAAADEVMEGRLRESFPVDLFSQGAGTSVHMNVNEVLANRAAELLGGKKGEYHTVEPHDHVNRGQSTNDTFPAATRVAVLAALRDLDRALAGLIASLRDRAKEFHGIVKSARTHLQDAVPIRLGQEFGAYAEAVVRAARGLEQAGAELEDSPLGATAVGTGITAAKGYRPAVIRHLAAITGLPIRPAKDLREGLQSHLPFSAVSGALRNLSLELIRVANDLRLLSSGPATGLAEIVLPPIAPGSSIMPDKVNPSVAEMVDMAAFQVCGADTTVAMAAQAGQLDLNVMTPVVAQNLLRAVELLTAAIRAFDERCVRGIRANEEKARSYAERTSALVTALNPIVGYARAAELSKEAKKRGVTIPELLRDPAFGSEKERAAIADLAALCDPPDGG
ncbi:MAG TPA: aspartate ammonia-lyase [Planctomycetota bacterium]|jgi:aspartate ammonia-lyase|nr:aspartate ammonia-lyase [Planctomycetota bacterium]